MSVRRSLRSSELGQAQLELVAAIPIFACVAVAVLQLLAVGYSQTLADGAAEAGAYAAAAGRAAVPAARSALPGWARGRARIEARGNAVRVSLASPSLLPGLGEQLRVDSSAWSRSGG